jgi:hypothetical protein
MIRYDVQQHQQLGHEMKPFRSPPLTSLHHSPSPVNRVHCSTPHKPLCTGHILAVMRVQIGTRHHFCKSLYSDRLIETARREAAEIADKFPFELRMLSNFGSSYSSHPATVFFVYFIDLQPTSQRQSLKDSDLVFNIPISNVRQW